jgi:NAD(P)-dependent dehydrogenase (short-subunit alcohol dehydrogenase family)
VNGTHYSFSLRQDTKARCRNRPVANASLLGLIFSDKGSDGVANRAAIAPDSFVTIRIIPVCIWSGRRTIDAVAIYSIHAGLTMKLHDKVALITGSARGLGWEMVEAFAQEGAKIAICDLSQSDVDAAAASLGLPAEKVLGVKADVTSEREVSELFSRTLEKFHRLDILVNNAGFAWPRGGPVNLELAETSLEMWRKVLDTNLTGTFLCSRQALKIMRPQGSGSIINISSPQGKQGKLLRGPYCAAKFGVEGFTQVLALENVAYNIRVNCLDPGGIVATEAIKNIPGNRGMKMLSPEIVRACAVYLASDESGGITGRSFVATEWNQERGLEVPYTVA